MFDYSALTFENHINDNVHDKFNSFSFTAHGVYCVFCHNFCWFLFRFHTDRVILIHLLTSSINTAYKELSYDREIILRTLGGIITLDRLMELKVSGKKLLPFSLNCS